MSGQNSSELYDCVIRICDDLYANRRLITKKSVKKIALLQKIWQHDELEMCLPRYINEWRLNTLEKSSGADIAEKISKLEAQVCKYKTDLLHANKEIQRLQAELLSDAFVSKTKHAKIVAELRQLLD